MNDENKRKIMFWDDAGFLMHKQDSIEKIREDAIKLIECYNSAINSQDVFFTSIYSTFRIMHIRNVFLIGLIGLIERIDRLNE